MRYFVYGLLLVVSVLGTGPCAAAREKITSFESYVDVLEDGQLAVEESITVVSQGQQIRHGIYRDFPTRYTDSQGNKFSVDFHVVSVERDGNNETYHLKKMNNGVRVYMGDQDMFLEPGVYTYTLHYVTNRQIGFFPDHDELYWNVTGNGWIFPVERAQITLSVPEPGGIDNYTFYTGVTGSRQAEGRLVSINKENKDTIILETTAPLPPGSGFTVVVSWPKGLVSSPSQLRRSAWFFQDFFFELLAFVCFAVLIIYYYISWLRVGKDPLPGAIIPRFVPPDSSSPAAARFLYKMGYDNKVFAALLVNMAVKGVLSIKQLDEKYRLNLQSRNEEILSPGEQAVLDALFAGSNSVLLGKKNNVSVQEAVAALKKVLNRDILNIYFKLNRLYLIPGALISAGVIACVIFSSNNVDTSATIILWITMWTAGITVLFVQTLNSWQSALRPGSSMSLKSNALFSTIFFLVFFGGWLLGARVLVENLSNFGLIILFTTFAVNGVFVYLLKVVTLPGRHLLDQLEGLKMYMSVAEKDRLNILNPPEKTPELFEQLLPWALALDVEQQWSEKFAALFQGMDEQHRHYHPIWYDAHHGVTVNSLSSSLGESLSSSIASSSVVPGSSSGFSGGGGSGGGGGGGGGGGW
jgi:uncharacterized membrane protein YgcG